MLRELHDMMHNLGKERNDQIINWGAGAMAVLLGIVGYLLAVYVVK